LDNKVFDVLGSFSHPIST